MYEYKRLSVSGECLEVVDLAGCDYKYWIVETTPYYTHTYYTRFLSHLVGKILSLSQSQSQYTYGNLELDN